ncbi:MAG: UDP-N-acetylmuramate dehydrogenase [Clostridia bacterium]|nr:UDP-N-acetylmuramate dehydrogenase [Clostridia bacterium]
MEKILEKLKQITSEENIYCNEPMKNHTTFKTGGNADILVIPTSKEELVECLKLDVPKFIIGNGSNLVVKDGGLRGLVIKTTKVNNMHVDGEAIEAETGCFLGKIAMLARDNSLTGFEFASGIPGTLGGAVSMNAGAYGGEIKDVVIESTYADLNGNIHTILNDEHEFGKRKSFFTGKDYVILSSKIQLKQGNYEEIKRKMDELREARNTKQPVTMPSAGSVFKRPEGFFAGKLIEDSGLKGYRIGGAEVSTLHAGFIVNAGGATSKDILDLIKHIQETVQKNYGVMLETEVKIIGED